MKEVIDKLSSYNLFNNLLPGVIFCFFADEYLNYRLIQNDLLIGVFLYYFVGLVISRIGSLIAEPIMKFIGFIQYTNYNDYLRASNIDKKIDPLLETNNIFRSMFSLFICILSLFLLNIVLLNFPEIKKYENLIITIFLTTLFMASYIKQTSYIKKRIDAIKVSNEE